VYGGLRLSISTLTVLRAGAPRVDARAAGFAMASARWWASESASRRRAWASWRLVTQSAFVSAVAAVSTLAAVTRGLHLDGLADTADGLGANRPADEACG